MNKIALLHLLILFLFSSNSLVAQENREIHCKMSVEDVLRDQPFDIDDAIAEKAKHITILLFDELNAVYDIVNEESSDDLSVHLQTIDTAVNSANTIDMNLTMFKEDLDFIESLKNQ